LLGGLEFASERLRLRNSGVLSVYLGQ